jgi:hypothetical protein
MESNMNNTRYQDLKTDIDRLRKRWRGQVSFVALLIAVVTTIKNIITLDFYSLSIKKEQYIFEKRTMSLTNELYYIEKIIREIKIRDENLVLKKDDLNYYGFDYEKLIIELDYFLGKYEPLVISRGGYIRDKNDKEFSDFMKQLKPLRKLKDLLESLE